ncbi:MAG: hypothetical protein ACRCYU_17740 [Nocardioides sp.]
MNYVEEVNAASTAISAAAAIGTLAFALFSRRSERRSSRAAQRAEESLALLKRPLLEIEFDPVTLNMNGSFCIRYQLFILNTGPWAVMDIRVELQLASGPQRNFTIARLEARPPTTRIAIPAPTGQADPRFFLADVDQPWQGYDRVSVTFSDDDDFATWTQEYKAFRRWDPAQCELETTEQDEGLPARILKRNR